MISIRDWQKGFENPQGVAVVFDIFRCSTTIHCLLDKAPQRGWISPSVTSLNSLSETERANYQIYSELKEEISSSGRFDNSPTQALQFNNASNWIVSTTTGTPAMFAARGFEKIYVGSLVSFSALIKKLAKGKGPITLIPAAYPEFKHVEDAIVAQAVATVLDGYFSNEEFVTGCLENAISQIHASGRPSDLQGRLNEKSNRDRDVSICLDVNRFSFVPEIKFSSNSSLAKVVL